MEPRPSAYSLATKRAGKERILGSPSETRTCGAESYPNTGGWFEGLYCQGKCPLTPSLTWHFLLTGSDEVLVHKSICGLAGLGGRVEGASLWQELEKRLRLVVN